MPHDLRTESQSCCEWLDVEMKGRTRLQNPVKRSSHERVEKTGTYLKLGGEAMTSGILRH